MQNENANTAKPEASAKPAKAARKAKAKTGKAPKAAKPGASKPAPAAANNERAERTALTQAAHANVAKLYTDASKPVHSRKPGKLADYLDRIKRQPQACGAGGTSDRDHALLLHIASINGGKAGAAFDPSAPNVAADLGVISRLASVKYIAATGNSVTLTALGAERIALLRKRA